MALTDKLTAIANAIRGKTGSTEKLTLDNMATAIDGIEAGGGGTSGIYITHVTPTEDTENIKVVHNLGTTDILLAACWAETLDDIVPTFNGALGKVWAKTDITN